jgi:hypothetical protein
MTRRKRYTEEQIISILKEAMRSNSSSFSNCRILSSSACIRCSFLRCASAC